MANPSTWIPEKIKRLNEIIWQTPLTEISRWKNFLFRQLRIVILAAKGYANHKVQLRASALTFYSVLSIIPVAAIAFAIAKGFDLDKNLEQLIMSKFQSEQEVLQWLLKNATDAIEKTRGGYMAGVGVVILFWSVLSLLSQIESSFNHIWQIGTSRPWYRKFTDYITLMLIAPVFIILSSSFTVFINTELTDFMFKAQILDFFKPVISFLIKLIPYFLTWMTLTILFIIVPNTKVKFIPALIAGVIAGTILQGLQWLYIDLQFGITKLSAIYGSFAAVPLFVTWLQSSWIVVLLGAEISFANQNVTQYAQESEALNISNYQKRALVLMIMHMIIRNFEKGERPISASYIASHLKIPVRLSREILQELSDARLVSIIHDHEEKERLYQPSIDINKLTISYVLDRLDKKGIEHSIIVRNKDYDKIVIMMEKFDKLIARSDANILLMDL